MPFSSGEFFVHLFTQATIYIYKNIVFIVLYILFKKIKNKNTLRSLESS